MKTLAVLAISLLLSPAPASSQLIELLEKVGLSTVVEPNDSETIAGLKEALKIGTEKAVSSTGREDGYFGNEAIKIWLPENLAIVEKGLRMFGQEQLIDDFILSMNRAAEQAAPYAREIFLNAILEMRFDDARRIVTGGDTAATDYFRAKTWDRLREVFLPKVRQATESVGVTRQYKELVDRYETIPFAQEIVFDVDQYVVDKGLDGLFYMLGEEERKIRTDPAARVTELLRKVFG